MKEGSWEVRPSSGAWWTVPVSKARTQENQHDSPSDTIKKGARQDSMTHRDSPQHLGAPLLVTSLKIKRVNVKFALMFLYVLKAAQKMQDCAPVVPWHAPWSQGGGGRWDVVGMEYPLLGLSTYRPAGGEHQASKEGGNRSIPMINLLLTGSSKCQGTRNWRSLVFLGLT